MFDSECAVGFMPRLLRAQRTREVRASGSIVGTNETARCRPLICCEFLALV
jgi:hypothetical protein